MNEMLLAMVLGGIGGLARSGIGLLKVIAAERDIFWRYFWITTIIAVIIGIFAGTIFSFNPGVCVLSGYAGTDVLDGVYKIFAAQKVIAVPKQDKS